MFASNKPVLQTNPNIGIVYTSKDPKLLFRCLHKRALDLGIQPENMRQLDALQDIRPVSKFQKFMWIMLVIVLTFTSIVLSSVFLSFPFSDVWVLSTLTRVKHIDNNQCIVENPDILQDLFRAPIDCGICRGVSQIPRVSALAPEDFEQKYAYSGVPVVITDAMVNWTATINFTFNFFRDIYTEEISKLGQNCQFFPYKTKFKDLREVFGMSENRSNMVPGFEPWYIGWSNCDPEVANILRRHYSRPYFLPRQSESSKTDWIFIGTPGFGAHMHIDNVHNPSWQGQIRGYKIWQLEPPPECYDVCVPRLETTLAPGDIIVVDTNSWYHATTVIGDDLSICIGSEYD